MDFDVGIDEHEHLSGEFRGRPRSGQRQAQVGRRPGRRAGCSGPASASRIPRVHTASVGGSLVAGTMAVSETTARIFMPGRAEISWRFRQVAAPSASAYPGTAQIARAHCQTRSNERELECRAH